MPTLSANIKWATNIDELRKELKSGTDQLVVLQSAADKTTRSLGGEGLIRSAHNAAAAVQQLGGVNALTSKEQDKLNSLMDRAVSKMDALNKAAADAGKPLMTIPATFKQIADQTERSGAVIDKFASSLKTVGQQATSAGTFLTASLTVPLTAIGVGATKAAMDFETAFAGVRKTVGGTPAELEAINEQFREMAKTTPMSAVNLAKIGEMAGQLGVQKDKITSFTKTIVDISVATNLTADEAGAAFARLSNVMKIPQEQFSNLGSAVVALGNFGASTEQEMLNMAQRIAAAGATAGMTAPQVLGIANALSSVGIEAEAGGTAISRVINKMSMDVASGGGHLETFAKVAGMSAAEFSAAWRDNAGLAFSKFMQGLADARKHGGDELLGLIHELGFDANVRLANSFMSAANAGDLMRQSIELGTKSFKDNTELARAAGERYQTTANQLLILKNNITDIAITIGNALLPAIKMGVSATETFIPVIDNLAKMFAALPQSTQLGIIGIGAVVAAIGPALVIFGQMAGGVSKLIELYRTFGKTLAETKAAQDAARDLSVLDGAAKGAGSSLGLLGQAGLVAGAALAGWELGKLINQLLEVDTKAQQAIRHMEELSGVKARAAGATSTKDVLAAQIADLEKQLNAPNNPVFGRIEGEAAAQLTMRLQTLHAELDAVSSAIQHGAAANISYTDAIKYNTEWAQRQIQANKASAAATQSLIPGIEGVTKAAGASGAAVSHLAELNALYAKDLQKIGASGFKEILQAHKQYGESVTELAKQYGVSESSIDRYIKQQTDAANASKGAASETKKYADVLAEARLAAQPLTAIQKERIDQLETLGLSETKIAQLVGVSSEQVKRYTSDLKENAKEIAHIGDALKNVPRGVQLDLPSRDLSKTQLPPVDVSQVPTAAGAVAEATFNDIEGRMRSMGVHTRDELVEMARVAAEEYESMRKSGLFSAQELQNAWDKVVAAQKAADLQMSSAQAETANNIIQANNDAIASSEHLNALNSQYAADLQKIGESGFKEIITAHNQYKESVADLAKKYDVASSSIEHYIQLQKDATKTSQDLAAVQPTALIAWQQVIKQLPGQVSEAFSKMELSTRGFKETVSSLWKVVQQDGKDAWTSVVSQAQTTISGFINGALTTAMGKITTLFNGAFKDLPAALSDAFSKMLTGAESFKKGFTSIWQTLLKDVENLLAGFLSRFVNGFLNRLSGYVSGSRGGLTQGLGGAIIGNVTGGGGASGGGQIGIPGIESGGGGTGLSGMGGAGAIGIGGLGAGYLGSRIAGPTGAAIGSTAATLGGSILLGTGAMTAGSIGGAVALGATTFGIGAAAVGAYALIKHFMSTAGRDAVQAFVDQNFSGWDAFHKKLNDMSDSLKAAGYDSEQLWIMLSQGVSRGDPKEAAKAIQTVTDALNKAAEIQAKQDLGKAANDAIASWKELESTGTATADDLDAAWQKVHDAVAATGDVGLAQQFDEADKSVQKVKATIGELDDQIASLQQSVDQEAPEAVMGTLEKKQRAQLEVLKKERKDAQTQFDELAQHISDSIAKAIQDALKGPYNVQVDGHVRIDTPDTATGTGTGSEGRPGEAPEPGDPNYVSTGGMIGPMGRVVPFAAMPTQYRAAGGPIGRVLDFSPKGTDTVPAMLTPGETVLTPGQMSNLLANVGSSLSYNLPMAAGGELTTPQMSTVILEVDGRELARAVAPVLPGEARRLGVRVTS